MQKTPLPLRRSTLRVSLAVLMAAGVPGCKKDEEKADAAKGEQDAKAPADAAKPGTAADALVPVSALSRGAVLGHVMLARPSELLQEVRTQLLPQQQGSMLDEGMLRGLAGMQLGERSAIAQKVDLNSPLGCVWADVPAKEGAQPTDPAAELDEQPPVACVVGYTGGSEAFVTDLGAQGRQEDAQGHAARYQFEGEDVFVDALGDNAIALSLHPQAFSLTQKYLQDNILDRGANAASDVEFVGYVDELYRRYPDTFNSIFAAQNQITSDSGLAKKANEFSSKGNELTLKNLRETEQITVGASLEASGLHLRYAAFPVEGSDYQKQVQAYAAGPLDVEILNRLPAQSWFAVGTTLDAEQLIAQDSMLTISSELWAELTERKPEEVKAALVEYTQMFAKSYGKSWSTGFVGAPEVLGGLVMVGTLEDANARQQWRTWVQSLDPKKSLGAEAGKWVTWSFKPDALTVDGVTVDRWLFQPTPAGQKQLRKNMKQDYAKVADKTDDFKMSLDYAEVDGHGLFIVTPGTTDAVVKQALAAAKGEAGLGSTPALKAVLEKVPQASSIFALDMQGFVAWMRANFPRDTANLPAELGEDLTDVYAWSANSQKGVSTGEFVVSQGFIEDARNVFAQAQQQQQQGQPGKPAQPAQ